MEFKNEEYYLAKKYEKWEPVQAWVEKEEDGIFLQFFRTGSEVPVNLDFFDEIKEIQEGMMEMNFKDFNLILAYLWNQVDRKHFEELLTEALGHELNEGYVEEKWKQYQKCPAQFLHNFKDFFEAVCAAIKIKNYKG